MSFRSKRPGAASVMTRTVLGGARKVIDRVAWTPWPSAPLLTQLDRVLVGDARLVKGLWLVFDDPVEVHLPSS